MAEGKRIGVHPLAASRHFSKETGFSYFEGTPEELAALVEAHLHEGKPAPGRQGVLLVPVPPSRFLSGVVRVSAETRLTAVFEARRRGEDPVITVKAEGEPAPAVAVDIVVYSHEALGADASGPYEWEVVSVNARDTLGDEPPHPVAMARNQLGLPGGSPANYTADEFARAIIYWSTRAMRR